jgi:hypothetical protein
MSNANSSLFADLPEPEVAALLPDDPRWDEVGLLPSADAFSPLHFRVPAWDYQPIEGEVTLLRVFWDDNPFDQRQWDGNVPTLPPADLAFEVPVEQLTSGVHQLRYEVRTPDSNIQRSEVRTVTVDVTAPLLGSNGGQLQFDTARVTEEYLEQHADRLEGRIESYLGGKPGDVVTWYWNDDPFDVDPAEIVSTRTLDRADIGLPVALPFEGAMIRARGDGQRYAFYVIKDRAGNVSPESRPVQLEVETTPVPRVLPPGSVKEAPGSSGSATLAPTNARDGVTVVIPANAVIHDDETVVVQWAEPGAFGAYRATTPTTPGGREYKVPPGFIAPHFNKSLRVFYEVTEPGVAGPHVSQNLNLRVSDLTSGWPTVQSTSVAGGQLSLARVTDAARFTLENWAFMAVDQFMTVTVIGVDHSGNSRTVPVLTEQPVPQVAPSIEVGQISKANLQGFKLNERIEVRVSVSFDNKLGWKRFPSLTPVLVA